MGAKYKNLTDINDPNQLDQLVNETEVEYVNVARKGLGTGIIKVFEERYLMDTEELAKILQVGKSTLYSLRSQKQKLKPGISVKLLELSQLFNMGEDILGGLNNFKKWLDLPNASLSGMMPGELISFPEGIGKVKQLLGRIEYGVYS